MKKTVFAGHRFALTLLFGSLISGVSVAQKPGSSSKSESRNDVNVRIIERSNDGVREIERTYHMNGMSDAERNKRVQTLVDSLKSTRKDVGQRQMTIIIEDSDGDRIVTRENSNQSKKRAPADAYTFRNRLSKDNFDSWQRGFHWRTDSMTDQLKRFQFSIPRDFDRQIARPFEDWARNVNGKPSTIRGLDAYPNNPDHNQLNVRFTAPTKGDITIIVTNPKGKEVAKREIKDFSGEFVGQIDLGKKTQGTYFITVTQNEDGAVKRIVVE